MDVNMIVPNLLGTVITAIQIATYYYFYCKHLGIPPKLKEDDQEEEKENKKGEEESDKLKNTEDEKDSKKQKIIEQ
jgi:hypothetical protein